MRTTVDEKLAAVKQANETLEIHLATWLRSPSRESRERLDRTMIEHDDLMISLIGLRK
jgi:hypothetical protein